MDTKTAAVLRLSREKLNSSSDAAAPLALDEETPGSAPAGAATAAASAASMSGNATGAAAAGSASTGGASGHQSGSGSHTLSSALLWRRMIGCLGDVNAIEEPAILADVYTHLGNMLDKLLYLRLNQDFTYVRRSSQSDESDEAGGDQLDADDDEEDDKADGVGDSMVSTLTADAGGAVLTGAEDIPAADEDAIDFDDAAAASDPDDRADDADVETDDVADGATDSVRRRQRSRRSGGVRSSGSSASLPPLLVRPRRRPPRGAPAFIPPVAHIVPWLLAACRLPVSRFQEARLQALRLLCRATVRRHDNDVSPKHLAQFYWILH
uniref:NopRA1 domain-containing protein n=1 Tax=Macrostomum lignano TaxID=282301 RepID=A0A1I8FXF3_9PLAT